MIIQYRGHSLVRYQIRYPLIRLPVYSLGILPWRAAQMLIKMLQNLVFWEPKREEKILGVLY